MFVVLDSNGDAYKYIFEITEVSQIIFGNISTTVRGNYIRSHRLTEQLDAFIANQSTWRSFKLKNK